MTNNASNTPVAIPGMREIVLKDIRAKWGKFSEEDLSVLESNDDLVTQLAAKYSPEKGQAQRAVDVLLKGRQI